MTRWLPPTTPRGLALWIACLFSHGLLTSVHMALLDGPSMFLIALAIAASERGGVFTAAAIVGIAGLGRETNLLASLGLPKPARRWPWLELAAALVLAALPLLLWQDYLRSIYRLTSASGHPQLAMPMLVYLEVLRDTVKAVSRGGGLLLAFKLGVVVCLGVQAAYLIHRRHYDSPWWRIAVPYAILMLTVHGVVWEGYPGAVTRVTLPLAFGFNVLLSSRNRPPVLDVVHPRQFASPPGRPDAASLMRGKCVFTPVCRAKNRPHRCASIWTRSDHKGA